MPSELWTRAKICRPGRVAAILAASLSVAMQASAPRYSSHNPRTLSRAARCCGCPWPADACGKPRRAMRSASPSAPHNRLARAATRAARGFEGARPSTLAAARRASPASQSSSARSKIELGRSMRARRSASARARSSSPRARSRGATRSISSERAAGSSAPLSSASRSSTRTSGAARRAVRAALG